MGDYVAAQMAAEDFGGKVLGAPVAVIQAELQNKPDVGLSIARNWFDEQKVDAIFGLGNSAVALAVQELCKTRAKIDVVIAAGTTDLTGKGCSPYGVHWTYDNYSAAKGPANYLVAQGKKKWFFITSDYAFGHSLEDNASAILKGLGGQVVVTAWCPVGRDRLLGATGDSVVVGCGRRRVRTPSGFARAARTSSTSPSRWANSAWSAKASCRPRWTAR